MTCAKKGLLVMMVTTLLGLWGCTQSTPTTSGSARMRELEAKTARLEDDVKSALVSRDQARKKVALLEEQRTQLAVQIEQLERLVKDRDDLKRQVSNRTAERDAIQAQLLQFSRDLQGLATKIEQAATAPVHPPVTGVAPAPAAAGPLLLPQ